MRSTLIKTLGASVALTSIATLSAQAATIIASSPSLATRPTRS